MPAERRSRAERRAPAGPRGSGALASTAQLGGRRPPPSAPPGGAGAQRRRELPGGGAPRTRGRSEGPAEGRRWPGDGGGGGGERQRAGGGPWRSGPWRSGRGGERPPARARPLPARPAPARRPRLCARGRSQDCAPRDAAPRARASRREARAALALKGAAHRSAHRAPLRARPPSPPSAARPKRHRCAEGSRPPRATGFPRWFLTRPLVDFQMCCLRPSLRVQLSRNAISAGGWRPDRSEGNTRH